MISSFAAVIDLWPSVYAFAADCGVPYETAKSWKWRNSIPANQWGRLIGAAQRRGLYVVTLPVLAYLAATRAEKHAAE